MSSTPVLTAMFSLEYALIASIVAYFLFAKVKKLSAALARARAEDDGKPTSFAQLIEQQIQRTRKRIAGHERAVNDPEQKRSAQILSKRVEFLELEKDVADDKIGEQSYWQIICDRLNKITNIKEERAETEEAKKSQKPRIETSTDDSADKKKYQESILRYQKQLASVHQEFEDFRKTARRVVSLSSDYQAEDPDAALAELMADFKAHDERLHARLKQLENENKKLSGKGGRAEKASMALEQATQTQNSGTASSGDDTVPTASEEELKRLRDIIDRQYGSLDELRMALMQTETSEEDKQKAQSHLEAVERAQNELQSCILVLESENDRLLEELRKAQANSGTPPATNKKDLEELYDLRLKAKAYTEQVQELSTQLQAKDEALKKMGEEFDSMQDEYMRMYEKQGG